MMGRYLEWYRQAKILSKEIVSLYYSKATLTTSNILNGKIELLLQYWGEFTNAGLVPMQSSLGGCAISMSTVKMDIPSNLPSAIADLPKQGISWLYAMTLLRKRIAEQKIVAIQVSKDISENSKVLASLYHEIEVAQGMLDEYGKKIKIFQDDTQAYINKTKEEAQGKIDEYRAEFAAFQKDALKSAALKSPANSLGKLERGHLVAAWWWFGLAIIVVIAWFTFIGCYYFPDILKPLLTEKAPNPYAIGGMVLTSLVSAGIVLTSIIILLKLAIARINFSVAAGERKAMATAFRALLLQHAISDDQQMLFLQNIVGSKLPDYVNCNDIRLPAEELNKMLQTALNSKKGE